MERRLRICEHCGSEFPVASTGRPPKYCKATCRKNAWHQAKVDEAVKAAQQKAEEATAAAIARAVLAERRRLNRGNETQGAAGNRGNETPVPAQGAFPAVAPPPRPVVSTARPSMPTPDMSKPKRERGSLFPSFRGKPRQSSLFDDQEQPDARPETDAR